MDRNKISRNYYYTSISRINGIISKLESFQPEALMDRDEASVFIAPLKADIESALDRIFGYDTPEYQRYVGAAALHWPIYVGRPTPISEIQSSLQKRKGIAIGLLRSARNSLEQDLSNIIEEEEYGGADIQAGNGSFKDLGLNRKVFIVHGHHNEAKEAVARFLTQCDFDPIILGEQPSGGRTIIEKFEANADVGFVVVLLTPDDVVQDEGAKTIKRARQNVILELGYFIGKIGRDRVCALKLKDVELPSDILGVVWVEFDPHGAWKASLAKELQAAPYEIDWNKVMR